MKFMKSDFKKVVFTFFLLGLMFPFGKTVWGEIKGGSIFVQDSNVDVIVTGLGKHPGTLYTSDLYYGEQYLCINTQEGQVTNLGKFPAGTELIFRLYVQNTGYNYYTGPASRNSDGYIHVIISALDSSTVHVGFEDLHFLGDKDFNDHMFKVSGAYGGSKPKEPDSGANYDSSGDSGDPVNTYSGELFFQESPDLYLGGPMPLYFQRRYASYLRRSFIVGDLGDNWRHNFELSIADTGGSMEVVNHEGRVIQFKEVGDEWEITGNTSIPFQLKGYSTGKFILYDPRSGLFYHFNIYTGKLDKIEDGKGNVHTFYYSDGKLNYITDNRGRTLKFYYTTIGNLNKLTTVVEQQGWTNKRTVSFSYDGTGDNLLQFIDANLKYTIYTYNPPDGADRGLLSYKTFPLGNVHYIQTYYTTADGSNSGKVKDQTDAYGNKHTFTYDSDVAAALSGGDTTITDPEDNTRVHTHNNSGQLTGFKDENEKSIEIGYDSIGRRKSITDRLGSSMTNTYDSTSGKLGSLSNPDGNRTDYAYTSRMRYDITLRDLTSITYSDSTTEIFLYDRNGNMTSYTDQSGNEWNYTYNNNGQMLTETNSTGGVVTYTYNSDGTLASNKDNAGNITLQEYDSMRRLIKITHPDSTSREFTYNVYDNLLSVKDERGNTLTYTYDDNRNLISIIDVLGNTTSYNYDNMDRMIRVTDPLNNSMSFTFDKFGRMKTMTGQDGQVTSYGYDAKSRLSSITDAEGKVWAQTHDAENILSSNTNPLGNSTVFISDKMGQITQTTSPLGGETGITYDGFGRVTTMEDPLGQVTTFTYDVLGLLIGIKLPGDTVNVSYSRNSLGRITTIKDPNNNDWVSTYDDMGRLIKTTDPLQNETSYQYNNRNQISRINLPLSQLDLSYDAVGNLTKKLYSDGTTIDFSYDAVGRIATADGVALAHDANGKITESNGLTVTRDKNGRIETIIFSPGKTVTYSYDVSGLLVRVSDWVGGELTFTYDDSGRLTAITRPNNVTTSYSYDKDDRVLGIQEGSLGTTTLIREAGGQVSEADRQVPIAVILTEVTAVRTFNAACQVADYTYDNMGRLITDGLRSYAWDLASRLKYITENGTTTSFTYDAFGHRLSRTSGGATRNYVWNYALGLPSISVERSGGSDVRYFIHTSSGALLYTIEATDGLRYFYHYDEMGNTNFLTDDSGTVISSYIYSPYGEILNSSVNIDTPFSWQGKFGVMKEGDSGLYYMRARYYDCTSARFLSRDPASSTDPMEINPYQYATDNPITYTDPLGLMGQQTDQVAASPLMPGPDLVGGTPISFPTPTVNNKPRFLIIVDTDKGDGIPETTAHYAYQLAIRGYTPVIVEYTKISYSDNLDSLKLPYSKIEGILTIGHSSSGNVAGALNRKKLLELLEKIAESKGKSNAGLGVLAFWGCKSMHFYQRGARKYLNHLNPGGAVFGYGTKVADNPFKMGFGNILQSDPFLSHLDNPNPGEWELTDILGHIWESTDNWWKSLWK